MNVFVPLVLLFVTTACVSTRFTSNTDFQSLRQFSKILVVSKLPKTSPEYLGTYTRAFPSKYAVCVIDAGDLSFGNPDSTIARKARECGSEVILTLTPSRQFTSGDGKNIQSMNEVFLEMATFPGNQSFWKAIATRSTSSYTIPARRVVKQLANDFLIEGKIPPTTHQATR